MSLAFALMAAINGSRLLGHAVARAPTTAPSLAGLGPAVPRILIPHGWRRKGRPGGCRTKSWGSEVQRRAASGAFRPDWSVAGLGRAGLSWVGVAWWGLLRPSRWLSGGGGAW